MWEERTSPESGTSGFLSPLEKDGVVRFFEDGDSIHVKEYTAAVVAELVDSKEGVLEGGHNAAVHGREIGEEVMAWVDNWW